MDLALFDFDNTITTNDNWSAFLNFTLPPWRLRMGKALFAPLLLAYKMGLVSGSRARGRVARYAFAGRERTEVFEQGSLFARKVFPGVLRPEVMARIEWHKERGDVVVIVSASLDAYLSEWCRARELELICTELESVGGRLTGRYLGGDCSGGEKLRRVLERYEVSEFSTIYAYGDSKEDFEMMSIAHRRFLRGKEVSPGRPPQGL